MLSRHRFSKLVTLRRFMCGLHILPTVQLITLGLRGQFRIGICLREQFRIGIGLREQFRIGIGLREQFRIGIGLRGQFRIGICLREQFRIGSGRKKNYFRQKVENSMVALNEVFKYFFEG